MTITSYDAPPEHPPRPFWRPLWRGARGRCPSCSEGALFRGWLRPVDECAACGEDISPQRADDLPPYLVIFVVGHVVVAGYMLGEEVLPFGPWGQMALWSLVTIVMAALLMRPIKGATIGLQWSRRMFGFDGSGADDPSFELDGDRQ